MPLYSYECSHCGNIEEEIFKIDSCPKSIKCVVCGERAGKIITIGGIITDNNALWLPSVVHQMKPDYEKQPIETRLELKNYLSSHGLIWTG